jgi:gas vesicle protein
MQAVAGSLTRREEQPVANVHADEHRGHGFLIGLFTGSVLGAGLAIFLGPRLASEVKRVTDSARTLGKASAERYQEARTRVGETVDDLAAQGRGFRDDLRNAVTRKPKNGKRHATEPKPNEERATPRKRSAADRAASGR